jgi:hypothetical protein
MKINNFMVIDNFLEDPHGHVEDIFKNGFTDYQSESGIFKNIQLRDDEVQESIHGVLPDYSVVHNFARMSPHGQVEPNNIHNDEVMGEITCVLYLSIDHPSEDGTTIYDCEHKMIDVRSKFNRMFIFDSSLYHSRNIFSNFGVGESSRLIQVLFLNKNKWQQ